LLPPLRARSEDIPALVEHFVGIYSRRFGKPIHSIPFETMAAFHSYSWPGNIRELQNLVERAIILANDGMLANPFATSGLENIARARYSRNLDDLQRAHILQTLEEVGWVVGGPNGAATMLGLKRPTLIYRMKKLQIERPTRSHVRLRSLLTDPDSPQGIGRFATVTRFCPGTTAN
jgi:transcriptional regulator with GAF, ATPase, and Fis domain